MTAVDILAALRRQATRTRLSPLAWGGLYVALFCLVAFAFVDRPLALYLKSAVGGDVEGFFRIVTRLGQAELYLVPAGLMWVWLMVRSRRAATAQATLRLRRLSVTPGFIFAAIALSGILNSAVKFVLGRVRPRHLFEDGVYGFQPFNTAWGMNSFPSGHTQAAFAAMTALAIVFPRYDLMWIAVAVLVGLSRVFLTVHYLSDAVAGAYLAVAVTLLLRRVLVKRGIAVVGKDRTPS